MRNVPLRTSWTLVALLAVVLLFVLAPGMAWAQEICGVAAEGDMGDPGEQGFQIDGQFFSGPDADDWAQGSTYTGVILNDGSPNPVFVPAALYERDAHWAGSAVDPTHFDGGSNKNNDDISLLGDPWTVTAGSGPQKNDLTDLYAHARVFDSGGPHVWIILGAMTRAANGDSHVDFEWNIAGFEEVEDVPLLDRAADSYIVGLGPHAGRTANIDFIISADFTGGGTVVETHVRQWQWVTDHYEYVDITGTLPAGSFFICADDSELGAPVPYWGAIAPNGDEVAYGGNATPLQFVEIAVDLTAFGVMPWNLCTTESTIMFKTRSSQEFTAELKDFGLYPFPIVSTPRCVLNGPDPMCEDDWPGYAELCGPETPNGLDYKYVWFGPAWADSFVTTSPDSCVTITDIEDVGTYSLIVRDLTSGCWAGPCDYDLIVFPEPDCDISGPTELCVLEPYQDVGYSIGCPGFEIDQYTWSITSGNAQIVGGQGTPNVTVRVYDESFTLQAYIVDFHGDVTCDGTFTYPVIVHPNPDCEIMGEFALCLDDFGDSQDYSLGNCPEFVVVEDSCDWTLVGSNTAGAVIDDDTDCIATVTVAQAGQFTLHVEYVDENDCPGVAEQTVVVYPEPDCDIDGVTEICLDDATDLEYSLINCDDFNITDCEYSFTANTAGATIDDVTDCVATVSVSQAGSFTLHVEYEDENGCDGTADLVVTIDPEPECEITGTTATCLENATDLIYEIGDCPGFVVDPTTCNWWLTANTAGATIDDVTDCVATVSASQAGSFTIHVSYEDENGCDGEDSHTVTIYPEPDCEILGPTEVCLDDADALEYSLGNCPGFVIDDESCNWWLTANTAGATIDDVTDCVATVSASQGGQFTIHVTYEDENGCDGEDSHTVTIYPEPDCEILGLTEVCLDDADALEYSLGNCPGFVIDDESCNWWLTANTAGATIDDDTDCVATVSASQAGSFTIHVTYEDENGCDGEAQLTVTIYPEPDCEIQGIDEICFIDLDVLEYSLGDCPDFVIDPTTCDWWLSANTAGATIDDVTDCVATVSATQAGSFTIHVTYEDENGCDGEDSYTVTIYPQPPCMIDAPDDICFGDLPEVICGPEPPFAGAYRYEWTIGVPVVAGRGGDEIESALEEQERTVVAEHCYEFDPAVPGEYLVTLKVFDLQSTLECWTECNTSIRVGDAPSCFIDTLEQRPECGSEDNELAADVTPPDVTPDDITYEWTLVSGADCGWEITGGQDTDTVIFTAGDGGDCCGQFRLVVTAHYGDVACADSCEVVQCCKPISDEFCSFTKGYYGNTGGTKFGLTTEEIILAAIPVSDPLVLGVLGTRSLTITHDAALCIIDRLPGGGDSSPLPAFGDETLLPRTTCLADIEPGEPQLRLKKNGQFENNFLTQMIALSLNVRLWWVHPDIVGHLGDAPLCPYMQTLGALCGDDGICGSMDDVPVLEDCLNFEIDMAVLETIDDEYGEGHRDVEHLLMLANRVLAGEEFDGLTLGQVQSAVTWMNEGFDECRFLNHCGDTAAECPEIIIKGAQVVLPDENGQLSKPIIPVSFGLAPNAPNPVRTGTSIVYALPEESQVSLTIYNVKGQVVDTLADGVKPAGYHTVHWQSGSRNEVSAGVYFLRMEAVGTETGEMFSKTQKMVVIR